MATTITWKQDGYKHETAGNEYVSKVSWSCSGVDGDATGFFSGAIVLDRPEDADMEARATFATDEKLIAGVKEQLGATEVTRIEDNVEAQVAEAKAPTTKWVYPS